MTIVKYNDDDEHAKTVATCPFSWVHILRYDRTGYRWLVEHTTR
jgi:hypothetical protein